MPRISKTGVGVTAQKKIRFDLVTEGETFLRRQRRPEDDLNELEAWAKAELRKLGLPDQVGSYRREGAHWIRAAKGQSRLGHWRLVETIAEDEHAEHPTAHLAARVLRKVAELRPVLSSEDKRIAGAAELGLRVGELRERARISTVFGLDVEHGAKMREGHKKIRERQRKTHEEHRRWAAEADIVKAEKPNLNKLRPIAREVIQRLELKRNVRTVERALKKIFRKRGVWL